MGTRKSLLWPLAAFTLGGALITIIGEVFKTRLIGYMRFADFVDLVGNTPLYLAALLILHKQFVQRNAPGGLRRTFFALVGIFLFGHALHLGTNAVNTFSTEIRDYRSIIPDDAYALLYFLDETLSHLIIFPARYALLACLVALDATVPLESGTARFPYLAIVFGVLFGLWEAVVFVEGQKVIIVIPVVIAVSAIWLWLWRRSGLSLGDFVRRGPAIAFMAAELPLLIIGLGVYAAIFGGFVQPSEMGALIWFMG